MKVISQPYHHLLLFPAMLLVAGMSSAQIISNDLLPTFKNLTINGGLSNNEVKQVVQDKIGFVWLATGSGIDRYDGYSFQPFSPPVNDSLELERLTWRPLKLVIDSRGRYFMASDFAGLQMYNPGINRLTHFTSKNSQLPDNTILSIAGDRSDKIWIGTSKGLCRLDAETSIIDQPVSVSQSINQLAIDANQVVWIAYSEGGLARIESDHLQESENLKNLIVHDIYPINSDSLLLATESGPMLYMSQSDSTKRLMGNSPDIAFSSIYLDSRRNVWAGTFDHGLFYHNSHDDKTYQFRHETGNKQSLVSDHISCLFEDSRGNMWIGTHGDGVSVISNTVYQIKIRYNTAQNQATGNSIRQILRTTRGDIWYHNNLSMTSISSIDQSFKQYSFSDKMSCFGQIQAMTEYQDALLLATGCGLTKWSPSKPEVWQTLSKNFPQIPSNQIISLSYHYPQLFIGTSSTGYSAGLWMANLENGLVQHFKDSDSPDSLVGNQVTTVLKSTKGDLWIGTLDDLNLYRPTKGFMGMEALISRCNCLEGGSSVISILEDHQGLIWFGRIDNGGLVVVDPNTYANNCFRIDHGLPDNSITSIVQDYENNLWVGTYRGAAKIKYPIDPMTPQDLDLQIIGIAEGMPNSTIWNGTNSKDRHKIYFGTRDGLIEMDAAELKLDQSAPRTILSDLKLLNNAKGINKNLLQPNQVLRNIMLKPGDKVISVDFSADDFYRSEATQYAYRFSNLSSNWIYLGTQHTITFANLSAGEYVFEVRARLTNSDWGPAQKLHLLLQPPVHQRWWFITLAGILSLGIVYAIQQYRIQQLKKIQEIREQISRDLHDDIGSALTNIEIMSGLAARHESKGQPTLQRILKTARSSNESLHQIVWNMNPANDQLSNMLPFLAEHAARLLEEIEINLVIHDETDGASMKIQVAKRKDLFLAFKEALTNIVKHADATKVVVYFRYVEKMLHIVIEDDGKGLIMPLTKQGNGIANMKERLDRWGGKVDLDSRSDGGLRVVLQLPIP
jgi:signal transduction histidine kinase/ligand-binding sensor domain-containing protein